MSYYQGGQPPYQGYPPPQQQGYGQQQNQWGPPPPQQGYGQPPPPQGYQQPPYGAPPQGPQGQWGPPPPPQGYGAHPPPPQQQQYNYSAPPPQNYTHQPPPQGYPPQQQWGAPPPPLQQQQFNAPPPNQFGAPPPAPHFPAAPASLGYDLQQLQAHRIPMRKEAEILRKAMKGMGTDEKALIKTLAKLDPVQVHSVSLDFYQEFQRDLKADLKSETSGYFETALIAIVRGPLHNDVHSLHDAMKGMGTKENVLNDVLMARSNADINAIKELYQRTFHRSLEADLKGDLSAATETLFVMIVSARRAEDAAPVLPHEIQRDVTDLQAAFGNMITKNPVQACQILTSRNDAQLRAISDEYKKRFSKPLQEAVKSAFSGHMEDALVLLVARAENRALSDATQLEDSMAGFGTKDELLVQRVVRAHWNRSYMQAVRSEYQKKYKKDLVNRIKGETRGDYERLLVACVEN